MIDVGIKQKCNYNVSELKEIRIDLNVLVIFFFVEKGKKYKIGI